MPGGNLLGPIGVALCKQLLVYVAIVVIGFFGLCLFCWGWLSLWALSAYPAQHATEVAWASASWVETKCKIGDLGIGFSSGCASEEDVKELGPLVNSTNFMVECGGPTFCSLEDQLCSCPGGDVIYKKCNYINDVCTPLLSYVPEDVADSEKVTDVPDGIRCSHQQGDDGEPGSFTRDPAYGYTKACYCMPKQRKAFYDRPGDLSRGRCERESNAEFQRVTNGLAAVPSREPERVAGGLSALPSASRFASVASAGNLSALPRASGLAALPAGWCYEFNSQVLASHDLVLLPWAAVEVRRPGTMLDRGGETVPRCAYEYGAPKASREDARTSGNWRTLRETYARWDSSMRAGDWVTCWVQGSPEDQSISMCAVSLDPPGTLGTAKYPGDPSWPNLPIYLLATCLGGCVASFGMACVWMPCPYSLGSWLAYALVYVATGAAATAREAEEGLAGDAYRVLEPGTVPE